MRPFIVVEADPLADHMPSMDRRLEPVLPDAFLLQRSEEALHQAILLGCIGRDELLGQSVRSDGVGVVLRGEHQAVVGSQHQRPLNALQMPQAADQGFLERGLRGCRCTSAR